MQISALKYDDKHGEATVIFSSDDPLFHGHFDYQPILPGVALVDAVIQIVSQVSGKRLRLKRISNVKFFQVVQPEQSIGLKFDWSVQETFIKVQARWDFTPEQKIAALSCELVEETT
jgi:3-hydroxymyristoyl/3-hydroxydecanoyl-(acyl carrier protein) dehydratase